jgi:uncharacterized membrane protein
MAYPNQLALPSPAPDRPAWQGGRKVAALREAAGRLRPPHRTDLAMAAAASAASLTPSLVPKTVLVQGLVTGFAAVAGYVAGVLLRWLAAPVRRRAPAKPRERAAWLLLATALLTLLPASWQSHGWQQELAAYVGEADPPPTDPLAVLLLAALVLVATVLVARTLRLVIRWTAHRLSSLLPMWLALAVAVTTVAGGITAFADHMLRGRMLTQADQSFQLLDRQVSADLPPPADPQRSGGPGSVVAWSTLGREGRAFVSLPDPPGTNRTATGPPRAGAVAADPTRRPIRVYAGIDSARDVSARARLVVAELERTGALRRGVVCVVVPTGTGWVHPVAVSTLEAQWKGDTAVASMQYSYLPSVLSQVVDYSRVEIAAEALIGAVVQRWRTLPVASRPRLVLYGESLGSRGVERAMRSVPGAEQVVDGVLLVGPPNSNPTWSKLVSQRAEDSPLLAPVIDEGRAVRFWPGPELPEYDRTDDSWPEPGYGPRTLYLQHPSDPIVWWSPSLLWSEPAWVSERTEVSAVPPLRWRPVVTFWQVSGDLLFSNEVGSGHGHRYGRELADAWAAVAPLAES